MVIAAENIQVKLLQRNSEEITPDYGNCCRKYLNNAAPEKYSQEIAPDYDCRIQLLAINNQSK